MRIYLASCVLAACASVPNPTPLAVETLVATAPPAPTTPNLSVIATPTAVAVSPLPTPTEVASTQRLALVDQASEFDTTTSGWWSLHILEPVGQTFTPEFAGLDAVEVWTADQWRADCTGRGPNLQLRLREARIDGPIIGSSLSASLPNCYQGVTYFSFPTLVPLTPGQPYLIEIVQEATTNWGVVWQQQPDPYADGGSIVKGEPSEGDVWFRTGLAQLTPVNEGYCADGLWQHVRRADGTAFDDQDGCRDYVHLGQ